MYIKFDVKQSSFLEYLTHLQCKGKNMDDNTVNYVEDATIYVEKDGIWSNVSGDSATVNAIANITTTTTIKREKGEDIIPEIKISLESIIKFVKKFGANDNLSIIYEDDYLIIRRDDGKEFYTITIGDVECNLIDRINTKKKSLEDITDVDNSDQIKQLESLIETIRTDRSFHKLEGDTCIIQGKTIENKLLIDSKEIKAIITDSNDIDNRRFQLKSSENNKIIVNVEKLIEKEDSTEVQTVKNKGANLYFNYGKDSIVKTKITEIFDNTFSCLGSMKDNVDLYLENDKPLVVVKKTEVLELVYIITAYRNN